MGPAHGAQVGAPGGDDAVGVVGLEDRADGHAGDARLVAHAVGERRLEHASVHRLFELADLARRTVDQVGAGLLEQARDTHRVVGRDAAFDPVVGRDAHAHRFILRPGGAHGAEHAQRIAAAVFQAAAIFVRAAVGQRRDKTRQQVTVRAMQFQPVETGDGGRQCGAHEVLFDARQVAFRGRARHLRHAR
ncbi:hypothetical protein D3C87_1188660 [compost metagenome]